MDFIYLMKNKIKLEDVIALSQFGEKNSFKQKRRRCET